MSTLSIIKIGGNIIDNEVALKQFLKDFAAYPSPKILVHGGGKLATRLSEKLEIPTTMIDGRRVTDEETLRVVTMVYAGWINKTITAQLQALNCNAIGLSGADAGLIRATRRSPVPVDFGHVGDIASDGVDSQRIHSFLEQGVTPIFCSITADAEGRLLNCNADTIASAIAVAMVDTYNVRLIYCFEKQGVLSNPDDEQSVIPEINAENYTRLKSTGVVTHGMIPKIDNAFKAIDAGVKEVHIKHAANLNKGYGTLIKRE